VSVKQEAYDHVKTLILDRPLTESGFITEGEVASQLGTSRTPVREAFRSLEAEGLLELFPNRGAFVPPVTDRQIVEVMEARSLVETFCAERAVARNPALHVELGALLAEQGGLGSDPNAFIECDRRFHTAIVHAAGHHVLAAFYETLRDRQVRMGVQAVASSPERFERVLHEHQAIVDAFVARDATAVQAAVSTHIRATMGVLVGRRVPA
jgi:DNA-binding GntR family transcriptional regulator